MLLQERACAMCEAHWRLPGAAEEELAPDLGRVEIQAQEGGRRQVAGCEY